MTLKQLIANNELRNIDTNNFKEKFILRLPIRRGYILDITKNASQPIISNSGRYIMIFNGEIYNFKQIRKNLNDQYNLYLCNKSLLYLIGTKVDYIEDIMGSRFDFTNEKIETKCGCGTSFNFKL